MFTHVLKHDYMFNEKMVIDYNVVGKQFMIQIFLYEDIYNI